MRRGYLYRTPESRFGDCITLPSLFKIHWEGIGFVTPRGYLFEDLGTSEMLKLGWSTLLFFFNREIHIWGSKIEKLLDKSDW